MMLKHEGTTLILTRMHGLIIEYEAGVIRQMEDEKIAPNSVVLFHRKM
jgi:hypothetical protein